MPAFYCVRELLRYVNSSFDCQRCRTGCFFIQQRENAYLWLAVALAIWYNTYSITETRKENSQVLEDIFMLTIAVVEDEKKYEEQLDAFLARFSGETGNTLKVLHFSDGDEIAEDYPGGMDIILMDIQMRFMDGMTAARRIRERDSAVVIIFITNRVDYAVQGYQVDALDYILKPLNYFALKESLLRAIERFPASKGKTITLKTAAGIVILETDSITYVESIRHNLIYHTKKSEHTVRQNMHEAEELLGGEQFFRIHKGYLVNLLHVSSVQGNDCIVDGNVLPVSRTKKNELMSLLIRSLKQ